MAHKQREVELPFGETELTKGQARKLNALRIFVGGDPAEEVFDKRLKRRQVITGGPEPDGINMSFVDKHNLTVRMANRRFWTPISLQTC